MTLKEAMEAQWDKPGCENPLEPPRWYWYKLAEMLWPLGTLYKQRHGKFPFSM